MGIVKGGAFMAKGWGVCAKGACMVKGGMHGGEGVHGEGGMCGESGCEWRGRGHASQEGACMAGGGMYSRGHV